MNEPRRDPNLGWIGDGDTTALAWRFGAWRDTDGRQLPLSEAEGERWHAVLAKFKGVNKARAAGEWDIFDWDGE